MAEGEEDAGGEGWLREGRVLPEDTTELAVREGVPGLMEKEPGIGVHGGRGACMGVCCA